MTTRTGRRWAEMAAGVALAAVALTACGGSSTASHVAHPGTTTSSTYGSIPLPPNTNVGGFPASTVPGGASTTTKMVRPGATRTTAGVTAGVTAGGRCLASQLQGSQGTGQGAAGHIVGAFVLRNSSASPCTLNGYPGLQMLDGKRHPLPTVVVRGAAMGLPAVPPALVNLTPGGSASFSLAYEDVPIGNEGPCPTSAQLEITPPNDFDHLVVHATLSPCSGGKITVSPVVAGTNGVQGH